MREAGSPLPRPQVWAVGGNSKGQLGHGTTAASSFLPRSVAFQLTPTQRVVEIFCGYEHTFALTSDGDVLGFGNGAKGQLGIGNTDSPSNPQRVHLLSGKGVVMMAAGLEHSLALTESGDLYAFGDNLSGQLGLGHNFTAKEQTPQKVPSMSRAKIMQLACGQDHTAVLTRAGELFMFGNNRTGALGLAGHANEGPPIVASAPQLVTGLLKGKQVVQIGCGLMHTVALTAGGSVYCWGENGRGQLGTGDTHNKYTPSLVSKPLSSLKCIHVACGGQHSICVTDTDDVYGFGSDRHGQLGLGKRSIVVSVPSRIVRLGGRRVKNCIGGAWHTIIGTITGEQYLMGCILPSATPQAGAGGSGAGGAGGVAVSRGSLGAGAASASDPFALSCGEFRRLLLPQGAETCSKGHSLFYGQGLGAPPGALRKVVKSLGRLKSDFSRMLVRQEADVVFTPQPDTEASLAKAATSCADRDVGRDRDSDSSAVGAHLAVVRARCPALYKHVLATVADRQHQPREKDADGRMMAWRVCSPAGVPIDALQLVVCYLYQGAGVFEKQRPENEIDAGGSSFLTSTSANAEGHSAKRSEPSRARDRRDHMRSKVDLPDAGGEELNHGTVETSLNPWGNEEHEAAAGFGSFGGAYGSDGKYDGAGLDRLMRVMAAARTLRLTRLQGLCEKRAEAFIDYRTVHKVLRRAAEGGFTYLNRRCLEFCLMHLSEVCAPGNSAEVVRELSQHPQVLADVLSLSAASEEARLAAASDEAGYIPCIEALRGEAACPVPEEDYEADLLALFEAVVARSVAGEECGVQPEAPDGRRSRRTIRPSGVPYTSFGGVKVQSNAKHDIAGVHLAESEGDFKIRAGEGLPAVTVHRSILAARSGFFRALLESDMGDAKHEELTLKFEPVVGMSALLEFLRFLYTGRSGAMEPLTALEVLFLTKGDEGSGGFFQVAGNDELRAFCASTLFDGFNSDNALPILVRAKALGDERAVQAAIDFILQNFDECMSSAKSSEDVGADDAVEKGSPESKLVPACLEDDESPAVDLLLALSKRCSVKIKTDKSTNKDRGS